MSDPDNGPTSDPARDPARHPDSHRADGSVRLADRVAWLDRAERGEDAVYVSTLPDGPPMVLHTTAALIFLAAAGGGTLDEVVARVAEESGQPGQEIRDDVVGFVEELVQLGLVVRSG